MSKNENIKSKSKAQKRQKDESTTTPVVGINSAQVSQNLESTQIGKFSTPGGTGFAAEDANALHDQLKGHKVDRVGVTNEKNGADRLVDGKPIQTKYFSTANQSIGDAFDTNGIYRYGDMPTEVPSDQYEQALLKMRQRINEGKVPGYSSADDAEKLVKKGSVTYEQAKNIAKAGNIDSLKYDIKNGAVTCTYAFGIGFLVEYGLSIYRGETQEDALKSAVTTGLQAGSTSLVTSVTSSQMLRSQAARSATVFARTGVKAVYKTDIGKVAVDKIASASLGKAVNGGAAINHVSKLLRSNVITGAVTVGVLTLPDLYRASISKSSSWGQVGKNLVVNASGVAAGTAGWMAGSAAGAAIGTVIPVVGNAVGAVVGGIVGAVSAGIGGSAGAKYVMDQLVDDDIVELKKSTEKAIIQLSIDYCLTQQEFDRIWNEVESGFAGFYKELFGSGNRQDFVYNKFKGEAEKLISDRQKINTPTKKKVLSLIDKLIDESVNLNKDSLDVDLENIVEIPVPGHSANRMNEIAAWPFVTGKAASDANEAVPEKASKSTTAKTLNPQAAWPFLTGQAESTKDEPITKKKKSKDPTPSASTSLNPGAAWPFPTGLG